jgi:hypothetical protein
MTGRSNASCRHTSGEPEWCRHFAIDGDLVAFQRKEDDDGSLSGIGCLGLQFLHITLETVAHQLHPIADVAADRFFQGPQLLAGLFADEEPVMHEWILAEAAMPGESPLPCRSKAIGESVNFHSNA